MRPVIAQLEASKIREIANAGMGRKDVLAFWFGESDEVTPDVIRNAAIESLQSGETFYAQNCGLPELREALAQYTRESHPSAEVDANRIVVTSGGVSALMLAVQALVDAGDEAVIITPVWPNLVAQPTIMGAQVRCVPLQPQGGAWGLDLPGLLQAITERTRLLIVNAPNNPTGWTLTRDEQRAILAHCRRTGTWIVADEVYERLYFDAPATAPSFSAAGHQAVPGSAEAGALAAPSFLDIAGDDDRLLVVHSFSKSFLMTGWRLGWLVLPRGQLDAMGKLIEFNTSCAPVFVQRGGLAALHIAQTFVPGLVQHLLACRDRLVPQLAALPGVEVSAPMGGMYAFFRVAGEDDSLVFAKTLVREHGLGVAPGAAFGDEGEGWLRWCFASRDPQRLDAGVQRLTQALHL